MLRRLLTKASGEYGMLAVLLLLCAYYSWATLQRQSASGADGGRDCAARALTSSPKRIALAATDTPEDRQFVEAFRQSMPGADVEVVPGNPQGARKALIIVTPPDVVVATPACAAWLPRVIEALPALAKVPVVLPRDRYWPTFLLTENLVNVANQIAVIAIVAVGMTFVILTGGIDLSVGSLVALSAVTATLLIRKSSGGTTALVGCCAAAVLLCGLVGAFSGTMIKLFSIPPFIATLAMMLVTRGLAYKLSRGESIHDVPPAFGWLGRGVGLMGIPNAVMLMIGLFVVAYVITSRTRFGRYVYAVGGNAEAARLSGVNVGFVIVAVYVLSGLTAGLGGVILASQLQSGDPTYGKDYELFAIAAVVVGGTSLSGGEGKVLATLIGALIIAVIRNGMNLTGVQSYDQMIVLGLVILGAVLLDRLKRRRWFGFRRQ